MYACPCRGGYFGITLSSLTLPLPGGALKDVLAKLETCKSAESEGLVMWAKAEGEGA